MFEIRVGLVSFRKTKLVQPTILRLTMIGNVNFTLITLSEFEDFSLKNILRIKFFAQTINHILRRQLGNREFRFSLKNLYEKLVDWLSA